MKKMLNLYSSFLDKEMSESVFNEELEKTAQKYSSITFVELSPGSFFRIAGRKTKFLKDIPRT